MFQVYRVPSNLAQRSQQPVVLPLLQKLHQIILNTADPNEVGTQVAQAFAESFCADACLLVTKAIGQSNPYIAGWSPHSTPFYTSEAVSEQEELWPLLSLQPGKVLALNHAEFGTDEQSGLHQALLRFCNLVLSRWNHPPAQALLALTIGNQSPGQGLLIVIQHSTHEWTTAETKKLNTLSDLTAIALIQTIQLRHMKTLKRDAFLANQYQALSQNVLGNLHQTLDQEQLLKLALQTTVQTLKAERGFLLLLKYETPPLKRKQAGEVPKAKVVVNHEWVDEAIGIPPVVESGIVSGQATASPRWFWLADCQLCQHILSDFSETLVISDTQKTLSLDFDPIAPFFELDRYSALMVAPLIAPGQTPSQSSVLGFWVLQHRRPRIWNLFEQQFAESIAALVSSVIIHNQALRQVHTLVEERTAQLEQNQRIQTKLYEITRQQVEQLRQLNQLKDEFLDTLNHELRTPLATMRMAITMLRQPGMLHDRANKYVDVLEQEWNRENNLIQDLLLVQELESSPVVLPTHPTNVGSLVTEMVSGLRERWEAKQIFLHIEQPTDLPIIITDPQRLQRVLQELLTNAGKFARSQTTVQLKLSTEKSPTEELVVFSLTNYGLGITPTEQPVIFDKFRRGQGVTKQAIPGVGIGLALVKSFVNQLQGKIEVASHPVIESEGFWETRFTLRLPVKLVQEALSTSELDSN